MQSGGPRSPDPNAPVNPDYYDENGQLRVPGTGGGRQGQGQDDPFSDRQSVSTTGTGDSHAIPIKYLPRAPSDEALSRTLRTGGQKQAPADAARALDEARNNLFKNGAAPMRPARSPDLDLRLNPSVPQGLPPSSYNHHDARSPTAGGSYRDSYLSGNSGAPSYLSGSTDIHLDAPKIVTSRQVQVGRLQQAEVVQLGRPLNQQQQGQNKMENLAHGGGLPSPTGTNPFAGSQDDRQPQLNNLYASAPLSPATFGSRTLGSEISGAAAHEGAPSYRTLTPVSYRTNADGDGTEEDLHTNDDDDHEPPSTGDLRFSMGTFSRDSVSTMGTGRYLAHAQPPLPGRPSDPRESMASSRSGADSVLHGFPMIPPGQTQSSPLHHSPIPQSTSVSTLDHAAATMPSRPPTSYSHAQGKARNTQGSVGLGGFPFVPPAPDAQVPSAGLPTGVMTDGPPTLPHPTKGRNTIGMSTTSEGLGGFEFNFDRPDKL